MKMLNLVIMLQLILLQSPFPNIGIESAIAQQCQEGMYLHPKLNRCVLTKEVIETKEGSIACQGLSGDAYRECFEKNAQSNLSEEVQNTEIDDMKKGNFGRYAMPIVASTAAAYFLLKVKKNNPQCKTGSMWLLIGGAAAALITEISAQAKYKKKTKELMESYEEKMLTNESGEFSDDAAQATNAQTLAIEFKIEEMQARKDVATKRKKGYTIAALAYTAAVGLAIYEQTQVGSMAFGQCAATSQNDYYTPLNHDQQLIDLNKLYATNPEVSEIIGESSYLDKVTQAEFYELMLRKISNFIVPQAHGQDDFPEYDPNKTYNPGDTFVRDGQNFMMGDDGQPTYLLDEVIVTAPGGGGIQPIGIKDLEQPDLEIPELDFKNPSLQPPPIDKAAQVAGEVMDKQESMIDKAIKTPYIRAALAGVLAAHAFTLRKQAKDNEENAQKIIDGIKEILIDFTNTGGAGYASYCTTEDRKLPSKPNCYCYNKDGTQNQMRKGRDVCIFYTAEKNFSKGDYNSLKGIGYNPMKSCLSNDGKIDKGCTLCSRSPKMCKIIPLKTINGISIGSTKLFGDAMKNINGFNDGSLNASNFDEAGIDRKIRAFQKANKKLASDPKNKDFMEKVNKLKSQINGAYGRALSNASPKALASISGSATGAPSGSSALDSTISKNLPSKAKKKIESEGVKFTAGGSDKTASKDTASSDYDFGFGDATAGSGGVEVQDEISEVMDKQFEFNNNDIHKNKGGNIFKILSIRYQRSALIRLFDDKGEFKADEADNTDINKQ